MSENDSTCTHRSRDKFSTNFGSSEEAGHQSDASGSSASTIKASKNDQGQIDNPEGENPQRAEPGKTKFDPGSTFSTGKPPKSVSALRAHVESWRTTGEPSKEQEQDDLQSNLSREDWKTQQEEIEHDRMSIDEQGKPNEEQTGPKWSTESAMGIGAQFGQPSQER